MNTAWKIFVKDKENLRNLLNVFLIEREAEMVIGRSEGLLLFLSYEKTEREMLLYARDELGNRIEGPVPMSDRKENVFLLNKPKFIFNSLFPFLTESAISLVKGDIMDIRVERYRTINPIRKRKLGRKGGGILYRVRVYSPVLLRDYSNRDGKQCLTFGKGYPMILTNNEVFNLVNGGDRNGILAL